MRSSFRFLKLKKKSIQFRDLNASLRQDEDFLSYTPSDNCLDEHIPKINDLSPFLVLNFPLVSGFVIDPMHTMYGGCFRGRLTGIAFKPKERKLSVAKLTEVEVRLIPF